jgi:hypothetical protein
MVCVEDGFVDNQQEYEVSFPYLSRNKNIKIVYIFLSYFK